MHNKQRTCLKSAISLFAQSNQRSVLSWNSLLRAYSRHGEQGLTVLHLFHQMQQQGVLPNRVSFILTLSSLSHPSQRVHGIHIHACTQACAFRTHVIVGTSIFNMYGRCGSLRDAWDVFCNIPTRDIVSWNAMLVLHANLGLCEETLDILARLLVEGLVVPNKITCINVLGMCANQADIHPGRIVHNYMLESMLDMDVMATTSLVNMYGKCSCLEDAWKVFSTMPERNVVTWNAMIFQFAHQQSRSAKALELHRQMQNEGVLPDDATFVSLFSGCTSTAHLAEGERLYASILSTVLSLNVVVGNAVLSMYGKCGQIERRVQMTLDVMQERNVITWTTVITACAQNNLCKSALDYYQCMHRAGINPNQVTFVSVLDACGSTRDLEQGKQIHAHIVDDGCEGEVAIQNSLITMYGECCSLRDAQDTFHKMMSRDVVSWNSMIAANIFQEDGTEAFQVFVQMLEGSVSPNVFTYVSMFDVCASIFAVVDGKLVYSLVIDSGFERETILGTAVITMFGKFSMLGDAQKAFDMIREHNVISWTALITAYVRQKRGKEAIQLFDQMQEKGIEPNSVTFTSILSSFSAATESIVEAEQMCHRILNCGFDSDVMVGNSIVTLYGKCGNINCARVAFDEMQERDLISWNSMMAVYAQHGSIQEASQFLEQMYWEGRTPDPITFLSVIHACARHLAFSEGKQFHCYMVEMGYMKDSMLGTAVMSFYGKCGGVNDALVVFNNLPEYDVVSWTVLIVTCAQNGRAKEAIQLFHQMQQEGVTPNEFTFSNVINACSHAGLFHDGLDCFTSMVKTYNISPDVDHYVSMIDLLGRAGQIHQADNLISDMPFQPTSVPYMTLLSACRKPLNVMQGEQAAGQAIELDTNITAPYVVLSNIHSTLST